MTELESAIASLTSTDQELWLGSLVMFSVIDDYRIRHEDLLSTLAACSLLQVAPGAPDDTDVFRRVSTEAQRKRVPTGTPDVFENFLVRDVSAKAGVLKKIVRERVDKENESLAYSADVCDLLFNKGNSTITFNDTSNGDPTVAAIISEIQNAYNAERGCLNSYAIRGMLRRTLAMVNATNLRKKAGGAYFVSRAYLDTVESMEKLASALPDALTVMVIPILDDHKRREYVREAYEVECKKGMEQVLDEVTDLRKTGKPLTGDKFATMLEKYQQFAPQIDEYEELLSIKLGSLRSLMEILKKSIFNLSSLSAD